MSADATVAGPVTEPAAEPVVEPEPTEPTIRVVAGRPTPEELAALLAVLAAASTADANTTVGPARSRWSAPGARLHTAYGARAGGWRASGMPR